MFHVGEEADSAKDDRGIPFPLVGVQKEVCLQSREALCPEPCGAWPVAVIGTFCTRGRDLDTVHQRRVPFLADDGDCEGHSRHETGPI